MKKVAERGAFGLFGNWVGNFIFFNNHGCVWVSFCAPRLILGLEVNGRANHSITFRGFELVTIMEQTHRRTN